MLRFFYFSVGEAGAGPSPPARRDLETIASVLGRIGEVETVVYRTVNLIEQI